MRLIHNIRAHTTHTGDIPEAPEDLFLIRPLLSRSGDITDFPNTYKQTQNVKQNEETEEYIPKKE